MPNTRQFRVTATNQSGNSTLFSALDHEELATLLPELLADPAFGIVTIVALDWQEALQAALAEPAPLH
jgi:hypothetical protein